MIIGTTAAPLDAATLTTTASNNAAVSSVQDTGTTVIETATISGSFVHDVDFAFVQNVDYDCGDLPLSYATPVGAFVIGAVDRLITVATVESQHVNH